MKMNANISINTAISLLKEGKEIMVKPYDGDAENFTGVSMADFEDFGDAEIKDSLCEYTDIQCWEPINKDELPDFKDGFTCWLETFFHLSCEAQSYLDANWDSDVMTELKQAHGCGGHSEVFQLVQDWTKEFSTQYPSQLFYNEELDYYETLESFFNSKNTL